MCTFQKSQKVLNHSTLLHKHNLISPVYRSMPTESFFWRNCQLFKFYCRFCPNWKFWRRVWGYPLGKFYNHVHNLYLPHNFTPNCCEFKSGLGIRSFAHHSFAHFLILLKSNERLWAIRSDRSRQMRNCGQIQIAQVVQDKWATVRNSLRSLMTNERPWAICSGCSC